MSRRARWPGRKVPADSAGLVDCANDLARRFYALLGYKVPEGYAFHKAEHPQEQACWEMAIAAFDLIAGANVEKALADLEGT